MPVAPAYTRQNVMVGQARMFLQPYIPASPPVLPNANTVLLGGAWSAPWLAIGGTLEGVTVAFSRETQDIMIEEQVTPVAQTSTSVTFSISVTFSEDTLEIMRWAYGGGTITTTAAASGVVGKKTLTISTEQEHFSLGLEGQNPQGFYRRMLIPDVTSVAEVETQYRRADSQRLYAATFTSLVPPEDVIITDMTAAALP